jgi:hypothetical protein
MYSAVSVIHYSLNRSRTAIRLKSKPAPASQIGQSISGPTGAFSHTPNLYFANTKAKRKRSRNPMFSGYIPPPNLRYILGCQFGSRNPLALGLPVLGDHIRDIL